MTEYNQKLPKDACFIINELEKAGYEAYIVGGCVRDLLMNREPHDWDITTSAKPEEVKAVFPRTYDTGIAHGTVTVIVDEEHYEVTTYRVESDYEDCRHPLSVEFVEDITKDLSRRDFTMNAIAYHPVRGFVDPYDGQTHIKEGRIVSVRDAKERFSEDALRILRAVRFHAQLGFEVDAQTIHGIEVCRHLLTHISKERIREEFVKILLSSRPEAIRELYEWELMPYIIPEYVPAFEAPLKKKYKSQSVADHAILSLAHAPQDSVIRLCLLLHDLGKSPDYNPAPKGRGHVAISATLSKSILKELRFDNQTIQSVFILLSHHAWYGHATVTRMVIKRLMGYIGVEHFEQMMAINEADLIAQQSVKMDEKLQKIQDAKRLYHEILESGECYTLKMLAVNGQDLMRHGMPKGKAIGEALNRALGYVIKNPEANTKEALLTYLELL